MKKNNSFRLGIDLANISRFKNQLSLAKKILSPRELKIYQSHPQPAVYLAGRFAGKEAFIKALNTPPLPQLNVIEVLNRKDGSPFISFQHQIYPVSLSHDGDYVVAVVIMI